MTEAVRTRGRIPASEACLRERELLETARSLFLEHGYGGVAVESLARSAHVSPKTIYARYGGKDGLFVAAMKPEIDPIFEGLAATPSSAAKLEALLATFGARLLEISLSAHALRVLRLLVGEAPRFPKLARTFYDAGPARALAALTALLTRSHEAGILACPNPGEAAEFFLGALQGERLRVALLFNAAFDAPGRRARAKAVARLLVAGYRKR